MYAYTDFDKNFVRQRAAQYRDQLDRHLAGQLPDDEFRALRLQNGWYVQRHAPMLRVAVPYGELSAAQLRALAGIARDFDRGYAHFTTRQNLQYNWIPLDKSAEVMDRLAAVHMHGIQTSGNCIRNITSDCFAGIAPDELVDPRPYAEIMRQWSTLHPEFAFLPRKFKIAVTGAGEDRAAIGWHDIGLHLLKNDAGEVGFKVLVGGGMGRTPVIGTVAREFLPWQQILVFIEAVVRVYNRYGRRDNIYKARIKILVKAEGQRFFDDVEAEFKEILERDADGSAHLIPQSELDRVTANFVVPAGVAAQPSSGIAAPAEAPAGYGRWLERNVHGHRLSGYRAVTLSLKRTGQAPGDITDTQMELAADLAERYSHGELRVSHDQNLVLPWVLESDIVKNNNPTCLLDLNSGGDQKQIPQTRDLALGRVVETPKPEPPRPGGHDCAHRCGGNFLVDHRQQRGLPAHRGTRTRARKRTARLGIRQPKNASALVGAARANVAHGT